MNVTVHYEEHGRTRIVLHDVQRELHFTRDVSLNTIREAIIGELLPDLHTLIMRIAELHA